MNAAAWICLALPLASTLAIALSGMRISRRTAGYVATLTSFGSFAAAVVAFVIMLGEHPGERAHTTTSWTWLSAGQYHFGFTLLTDHLLAFEVTSIVLLVAAVGGVVLGAHARQTESDARA